MKKKMNKRSERQLQLANYEFTDTRRNYRTNYNKLKYQNQL